MYTTAGTELEADPDMTDATADELSNPNVADAGIPLSTMGIAFALLSAMVIATD
jgi:hypothetical protein